MVRPISKKVSDLKINLGDKDNSINDQIAFYDNFWDVWHEKYRYLISFFYHFDENSRLNKIKKFIKSTSNKSIKAFDLGCGNGRVISIFQKYMLSSDGADLSKFAINNLKKKYPNNFFVNGDIFKTCHSIRKNYYDIVVCSEVIEHINVDKRNEFVNIIIDMIVPNGSLVLTTPNKPVMLSLGLKAEQPLDFWMDKEELLNLFSDKFEVLQYETMCMCFSNFFLNRFWKLIPTLNYLLDIFIKDTELGKYHFVVLKKTP